MTPTTKPTVPRAKAPRAKAHGAKAPRAKAPRAKAPRSRKKPGLAARAAEQSAKSAANALLAAAVLMGVGALLLWYQSASSSQQQFALLAQFAVQIGLCVLFGFLWRVARSDPGKAFIPAAIGAALYVPLLAVTVFSNPGAVASPSVIVPVLVLVGLEEGIRGSLRYRRLTAEAA